MASNNIEDTKDEDFLSSFENYDWLFAIEQKCLEELGATEALKMSKRGQEKLHDDNI